MLTLSRPGGTNFAICTIFHLAPMCHVGYMAATNPAWFENVAPCTTQGTWQPCTQYKGNGALNYVEFRAATNPAWFVARPVRLERTTCGFEVRRSIQLSYGRVGVSEGTRTPDRWGHNPVLYPTELHSPLKRTLQNGQLTQPH
jgi:hypothetical protein